MTADDEPEQRGLSDAEIAEWARSPWAYLKIAAKVAQDIRSGRIPQGRGLPDNYDIAAAWDVSLSTAGKAKKLLAERGLIKKDGLTYYVP